MLTRRLLLLLAVFAGSSVATIYFNQPLLGQLAQVFGEPPSRTGLISTFTQVGYGLGIFLLVPLGDTLGRRPLIVTKLVLLTAVLVLAGASGSLLQFLLVSAGIGILATVAQDIVAFTAESATPAARGKAIGTVMSGLFTGILVSRTFSGVVAGALGWRAVFWIGAGLQAASAVLLLASLPAPLKREKIKYVALIQSMIWHIRNKPTLRGVVLTHGMVGIGFSAFWTCLAFHLGSPDIGLSTAQIGYFGLVGAAGTLTAPIAGRLVDRRGPATGILVGTAAAALSFAAMCLSPTSILLLIVGAFFFDMGLQLSLISHQTIVYSLDHTAISRLNAIFFTGIFMAYALGSTLAVQIFAVAGWSGVLVLSAVSSALAFANGWRVTANLARA